MLFFLGHLGNKMREMRRKVVLFLTAKCLLASPYTSISFLEQILQNDGKLQALANYNLI